MNQKRGIVPVRNACRKGTLGRMLEKYLQRCHQPIHDTALAEGKKRGEKAVGSSFPNLAGFCRFVHLGTDELLSLAEEYPDEIDRLLAILEDEALNSAMPPALLSIYLKKRLRYEREDEPTEPDATGISVHFEHDILRDGE